MRDNFASPGYSVGVEEELMVLDASSLALSNSSASLIEPAPAGEVKLELHESVLEIATAPCADTREAGEQLRALRRQVSDAAGRGELRIGSAGTHPFSLWEDQRISAEDRYRELVGALRFVARQEIIFGLHVHVGIDDADKAIHVVNGMRLHVGILLALSANSPYWRGEPTGFASTRMPIFRAFPRVGIPPAYADWEDYERRVGFMIESGVMEDPSFLWYDVRPHHAFGTVEVRAMDAQTSLGHTLALAALCQAMVRELAEEYEAGAPATSSPYEMLDENKWLAARHGLDGELVDLPHRELVATRVLARRLVDRLADHARDLGAHGDFAGLEDILEGGNGAARQQKVYEANHDLDEVMREIVAASAP